MYVRTYVPVDVRRSLFGPLLLLVATAANVRISNSAVRVAK